MLKFNDIDNPDVILNYGIKSKLPYYHLSNQKHLQKKTIKFHLTSLVLKSVVLKRLNKYNKIVKFKLYIIA